MKSICFPWIVLKSMFFQKNLLVDKLASPVIRTWSYNNNPVFNDWDSTHHFNSVQSLFVHTLDSSKTCKKAHRKTQPCRLRFHHKKWNLTRDNYMVCVLRAISLCVYCTSIYLKKKTTCLERQINSQLQLRSSVYNLVACHPELGII